MREHWSKAPNFSRYWVSHLANIIDEKTWAQPRISMYQGRYRVALRSDDQMGYTWPVARLVAAAFFDGGLDGNEVNHIDGDRTNDALWNLEIITQEANKNHAIQMGLMHAPKRIQNLDTGEIYESLHDTGRRLGYVSPMVLTKSAREGKVFERRGYRLVLIDS